MLNTLRLYILAGYRIAGIATGSQWRCSSNWRPRKARSCKSKYAESNPRSKHDLCPAALELQFERQALAGCWRGLRRLLAATQLQPS